MLNEANKVYEEAGRIQGASFHAKKADDVGDAEDYR